MAPNRMKTLYGVGVMHYGEYSSVSHPKAYCVWGHMIERCYSEKAQQKHPTYKECTVDPVWHNFQNFAKWYEEHYVEGFFLDKDLLVLGNKIYSPDTCTFVPRWLNNLLLDSKASRGKYPQGVTYLDGKYRARFNCNGDCIYIGMFETPELAYNAYCKEKGAYLVATVINNKSVPTKIKANLITLGNQLMRGALCQ